MNETFIRILWPFYTPRRYRGLTERQLFILRYKEEFGCMPDESEWFEYCYSSGEERVAFISNYSVSFFMLSAGVWGFVLAIILMVSVYIHTH